MRLNNKSLKLSEAKSLVRAFKAQHSSNVLKRASVHGMATMKCHRGLSQDLFFNSNLDLILKGRK